MLNIFYECPNLTSVTLNSNAIVSQSYTESYSIKHYLGEQVNSYIIGDDVRSIGEYAFSGCSALTSITIGNSVTSIGQDAFKNTALTKVIVNDIAAWCKISFRNGYSNPLYFANHLYSDENTEVTDLVIPNSVTSVNFAAFLGCSMLTSVIIPNSVTSIGKSAFAYCTGLNSVTIGNNVTSIGDYTFAGCYNLTSVTVLNPTPVAITQNVFTDHRKRATLYVPKGSKEAYEAADYWKEFKEIIEIEVSGIDQIMTDEEGKAKIFTLDGRRISKPQKGYQYHWRKESCGKVKAIQQSNFYVLLITCHYCQIMAGY